MKPKANFSLSAVTKQGKTVNLPVLRTSSVAGDGTRYDFELFNNTSQTLEIARVKLWDEPLAPAVEVFRQGFYMPSDPGGFYVLRSGEKVPDAGGWKWLWDWCGENTFVSHSMVVVKQTSEPLALYGFVSFARFEGLWTLTTTEKKVHLAGWCLLENIKLEPGSSCHLEAIRLNRSRDFNQSLNSYTNYVKSLCQVRLPRTTVTGWVDWQYYREEKNDADIMRSVRAMRSLKKRGFPLDYVIIDGGWCAYASEWLKPCPKFPDIKRLCQDIRRAGFIPGLWLAPYLTNVKTEVALKHPEWMVTDPKTNHPLFKPASNVGACYMLDFSVPAALEWLRKIVRTMVRDWKVGYIKLDGPNLSHYRGGKFHAPDATAVAQARDALRVIREECGEKILVEGEGIYGPSLGYVDIQRTTQDTNTAWHQLQTGRPLLKENLKNDLLSAFLHGQFWHNHRENVVLRDFPSPFHAGTKTNPASKDSLLTENQLLSQISATALAGGALLLSDPIPELMRSPKRLALISKFLPHFENQSPAMPLDVFQNGKQPAIYYLPVEREFETWYVVGVFNWDDAQADIKIPLKKITDGGLWHAHSFWEEAYLGVYSGQLTLRDIPPHGCRVLVLRRKADSPQLVGTNLHLLQGAVEIADLEYRQKQKTLRLTLDHFDQTESKIWLWHPPEFHLTRLTGNYENHLLDNRQPGILQIQFNGRKTQSKFQLTEFEFKF